MARAIPFEEFVRRARRVHGNKYEYDRTSYQGASRKVRIKCPTHGWFKQIAYLHAKGHGCNPCGVEETRKKLSINPWVEETCPTHGVTYKRRKNDTDKECPRCAKERAGTKHRVPFEAFLERARSRFGNRYEYDASTYNGVKQRIRIKCPAHGWFTQLGSEHLKSKTGCPRCSKTNRYSRASQLDAFVAFLARAREVHGDKYAYDDRTFMSAHVPTRIYCDEHGWFEQLPTTHVDRSGGCPRCNGQISKGEEEIAALLEELGVDVVRQFRLGGKRIDIAVPEHRLLIEHHGAIWHSDRFKHLPIEHQQRMLLCMERGYRLIQISDFEWAARRAVIEKVLHYTLGLLHPIPARKTNIVSLSTREASTFLQRHHVMGSRKGDSHAFGLVFGEDLVAVMTTRPRGKALEIARYAAAQPVAGGASRLIAHIRKTLAPKAIVSFADARYFTGCSLRNAGFVLEGLTRPGYVYIDKNGQYAGSRQQFQKHKLPSKLRAFDPSLTEEENCANNGLYRLYDAGHWKWVWKREN